MGLISIEGMEFFAYHGCISEERVIGTSFIVDFHYETNTIAAQSSDNLSDTLNYQSVYLLISAEMKIKSHLLEHVAQRILSSVLKTYPQISFAKIKLSKINPPLGGKTDRVSFTVSSEN
ncbi:MAG TPA: dihydroneopterin aldolase [Bacteroidales bacterium]|nr:dihydroneopterin aldolase [Bacteroidales bacterium]